MRRLVDAARRLGDQRPLEFKPSLLREANVVAEELSRTSSHVHNIIGELTHRTKNLMAVVEAIARQTLRSATSSEDFQHRFAQRIAGLAVSHDLLVHRDWKGVPLYDLVAGQVRAFVAGDETKQIVIEGPPVLLLPSCAQNVGMALHELATNAAKYGALSRPGGCIEARWYWQTNPAGKERLVFRWEEKGGPTIASPIQRGFGHKVVEQMVAQAIQGTAQLHWRSQGLVWTMDASAACAIRDLDQPAHSTR